jgi:hypothetical protein
MYWRIGPRYKDRPREDNKRDLERLAASGQSPGMLAFDGEVPVGWCEFAPRADLVKPLSGCNELGWHSDANKARLPSLLLALVQQVEYDFHDPGVIGAEVSGRAGGARCRRGYAGAARLPPSRDARRAWRVQ